MSVTRSKSSSLSYALILTLATVSLVFSMTACQHVNSTRNGGAGGGTLEKGCIYATCPGCSQQAIVNTCPNCRSRNQFGKHDYAMATPTQPAPGCQKCKWIANVKCGSCGTKIDASLLRWKE